MSDGAKYDSIGTGYDTVRAADPGLAEGFLARLKLSRGAHLLDLACGTGNYTRSFADADLKVTGIDRSGLMLTSARVKSPTMAFCLGDTSALPFADRFFDGAVCCLAIHHFAELVGPFQEVFRVLRQGRFVLFTSTPEQTAGYWLKEYFPNMIAGSAAIMPPFADIKSALEHAGFGVAPYEPWEVPTDLQDHFMYSGKHRPELYLQAKYRDASSGFRLFSEPDELAGGLSALEKDISTGEIAEIVKRHAHALGDYGYVIAEKQAT
jgi:ubiquinone/menaquinone biosynthesis C-methylase UbiE